MLFCRMNIPGASLLILLSDSTTKFVVSLKRTMPSIFTPLFNSVRSLRKIWPGVLSLAESIELLILLKTLSKVSSLSISLNVFSLFA